MSSTAKRWVDTLESRTYWLPPLFCINGTSVNMCLDYSVFAYILGVLYVYVCLHMFVYLTVCVSMYLYM